MHVAAEIEVPDLIGERDVVRMRGPLHPGGLRGRAVHGVEVIRDVGAGGPGRGELNHAEVVGGAGDHEPALTGVC